MGFYESYLEDNRVSFACVPMLQFLYGQPYDDFAMCFIVALRPSYFRVIEHGARETTNTIQWRVTVHLNEDRTIKDIMQECIVGCNVPDIPAITNGHALRSEGIHRGIMT